jgi:hypothetical protein
MSAEQLIPEINIDLREYNLIYYELETNKQFLARRITASHFKFYDPTTGLKTDTPLSRVRKYFKGDVSNRKNQIANFRKSKNIYDYE